MKSLGREFIVAILLLANTAGLGAQALRNTITFDNQSGEFSLVKLVGPTAQTVEVPSGEKRTVAVAAGEYYLLARYGADPRRYTYSRGESFKVEETATQYSALTITLHKVIGGNYPARPASAEEFDRVTPGMAHQARPVGEGTLVPALPSAPGFYRVEDGKYLKQPDCRGDECKMCVPKDWVDAVRMTPVTRRAPAILLQSLIVSPQKGQGVPSIITLPVDSPTLTVIDPVLKAIDSSGEALLLSFKENLVPGTYTVLQRLPGAVRYARFMSAQDAICFVALDSSSKYLETQAAPLGVFVVR